MVKFKLKFLGWFLIGCLLLVGGIASYKFIVTAIRFYNFMETVMDNKKVYTEGVKLFKILEESFKIE